jgi:hypothetical protein
VKIRGFFPLSWFGIRGIVLYPFVIFAPKHPDAILKHHEYIHWQQVKAHGFFYFYLIYLRDYLKGRKKGLNHDQAYREISFEKEAYLEEQNIYYLVSRESIAKYRSLS